MTVYRNADEARIDPSILSKKESDLLGMRSLFREAELAIESNERSDSYKVFYLSVILSAIKGSLEEMGF